MTRRAPDARRHVRCCPGRVNFITAAFNTFLAEQRLENRRGLPLDAGEMEGAADYILNTLLARLNESQAHYFISASDWDDDIGVISTHIRTLDVPATPAQLDALCARLEKICKRGSRHGSLAGRFIGDPAGHHIHFNDTTFCHYKRGDGRRTELRNAADYAKTADLLLVHLSDGSAWQCYAWLRRAYIQITGEDFPQALRLDIAPA